MCVFWLWRLSLYGTFCLFDLPSDTSKLFLEWRIFGLKILRKNGWFCKVMVHRFWWDKSRLIEVLDDVNRSLYFCLCLWFRDQVVPLCSFCWGKALFQTLSKIVLDLRLFNLLTRLSVCDDVVYVWCIYCVENYFLSSILVGLLLNLSLSLFLLFCNWLIFLQISNKYSIHRISSHMCVDCILLSLEQIWLEFWLKVRSLLRVQSKSWQLILIHNFDSGII